MKTKRVLKWLRRKARRKFFVRHINYNDIHFLAIAKFSLFMGFEYVAYSGGYTSDTYNIQRYFSEDECLKSLRRIRRKYILDCVSSLRCKKNKRKINKLKY